ncbi:MAG: (2Fe-2S)-binding protein [Dissulfurimicrobium sp.]|uniref:(2Fe-2S)-binding protein n=1 Tax=Dissulfurimicrobium TaxID=1769732 RepID=UPI001EDC7341|nr:(2Fe-2S)-binding protein [Dissulfurimicrobium hydrothermale]UKL13864.1 (2Fe-2S)-binding protein [Dissulfurimicrobium hydrothermale]
MPETICYCFNYTDEDIIDDVKTHGRSLILERIMAAKKAGRCECATKNPRGR